MTVRVGVDVGGTFTKAVAVDGDGVVAARSVVPTTHDHADGVAAGVLEVVGAIADEVGADDVALVTHSTTQAVNALLEGDTVTVGLIGMARQPDLRKARRRTIKAKVELADRRHLAMVGEFLDVTAGLDPEAATTAVARLTAAGVEAVAIAEAFAPDDQRNEQAVAAIVRDAGLPVCSSAELSGLYGLELRAVSAALNASILPIAAQTAETVGRGVAERGVTAPVMVMRGDGGATDLAGFRSFPARSLYSGPAASVAGALRTGRVDDAVILEIGGTSTNVAAIRGGRPLLSYVRVASHATAIRALDVRVVGVAGGSMLRVRRGRVHGVGPRSAHIAGLAYAGFADPSDLEGARPERIAPRPGDPGDYLVLFTPAGERLALTLTCASNALGRTDPGDYAYAPPGAARAAFALAGEHLGMPGDDVAAQMITAATQHIGELIEALVADHELQAPSLLAVGGGAGGLGRAVGRALGLVTEVPEHAEVISAVGDALSLIRVEREQAVEPEEVEALVEAVEEEAVRRGAGAASLDARVETLSDRGAVRVVVTGSVELAAGATPGRLPARPEELAATLQARGHPEPPEARGEFWVGATTEDHGRIAVLDRYGEVVVDLEGEAVAPSARLDDDLAGAVDRHTRRIGPVTIPPDAWIFAHNRVTHLADADAPTIAAAMARTGGDHPFIVIGRQ